MTRRERRIWRRTLRALRDECPTLLPVRVRLSRVATMDLALASLSEDGRRFNVTIRTRLREAGRVRPVTSVELFDSLIHEWAHCLAWNPSHSLEDHDALWGVAFARCYNVVSED